MEKQITAVEWLENELNIKGKLTPVDFFQAKEMERNQIIDAWNKNPQGFNHSGEKYYNETFKN